MTGIMAFKCVESHLFATKTEKLKMKNNEKKKNKIQCKKEKIILNTYTRVEQHEKKDNKYAFRYGHQHYNAIYNCK